MVSKLEMSVKALILSFFQLKSIYDLYFIKVLIMYNQYPHLKGCFYILKNVNLVRNSKSEHPV